MEGDEIMGLYDEVCAYYDSIFPINCTYHLESYPGVKECIEKLKKKKISLVCITNKAKEEAEIVLREVYPEGTFSPIIGDDGGMPLKPDKAPLEKACRALGITKEEAVMVGDTKTDLDAAKAAGMLSIGCLYGFRDEKELQEHGAKYIVSDGTELWKVLEEHFLKE